eukprot:TRINITY_DN17039_c0_g1_i2.p1 TRINITY_DN17039_c0_g1~~TRINITY_DN17039_c0_g1_i2.p1  ORF type:complete len:156 (-),score=39.55 TRINITY_DN17039_c0_g1_i2:14-481(-)
MNVDKRWKQELKEEIAKFHKVHGSLNKSFTSQHSSCNIETRKAAPNGMNYYRKRICGLRSMLNELKAKSKISREDDLLDSDISCINQIGDNEATGDYGPLEKVDANCQEDLINFSKELNKNEGFSPYFENDNLSLIHICRCRRYAVCRSRWSPYH